MKEALGAVLVAMLVMMPFAASADESTRMEALERRLLALEDELNATRGALEHSEEMRQQGIPAAHLEAGTGLDAFLSGLEVGGYVEASYLYNFNNPDNNTGTDPGTGFSGGSPQPLWQFNNNHNTFELDAVKLELGKSADEPGSAGFQIDLLFGANNHILCGDPVVALLDADGNPAVGAGGTSAVSVGYDNSADSSVCVQEAYVSYNYNDIVFQFGKWETLLGYELIDAPYNPHVTHGILFTWAIPLVHNGLLVSGSLNENIGWALGVTNGFNNVTDSGDNKGLIGQLSFEEGPFFASASAFVGSEEFRFSTEGGAAPGGGTPLGLTVGVDNRQVQIYDVVVTYDPSDDLHLWLNADYGKLNRTGSTIPSTFGESSRQDPTWYGAAGGFKYLINEKVSFAARGEYMIDDGGARFTSALVAAPERTRIATGTATLAYALTSNLTARVEYRHDHISGTGNRPFPNSGDGFCLDGGCTSDINVGIVEVSYQFD